MSYAAIRFVSKWTSTVLQKSASGNSEKLTQCLWGDWVGVKSLQDVNGWLPVHTRGKDGFLRATELMVERPLEVNFVDIGQGDGTFIVTPDDRMILIDAGEGLNMFRFLKWRFNFKGGNKAPLFDAAIITHPDQDHYKGFQKLFDDSRFSFQFVFHNGIVERAGSQILGPSVITAGQKYLTNVIQTKQQLQTLLQNSSVRGSKRYPKLLWTALNNGRVTDIAMLKKGDNVFAPRSLFGKQLSMKVLAPITRKVNGAPALQWFADTPGPTTSGNVGKTKNGHSIVTILEYGSVRIMLGGDLNTSAESFILNKYSGNLDKLKADITKACHHGSSDFSNDFIQAVNALATVISSGDNESYSHPRADALGAIGKYSRGSRSLIFSTELARSSPERFVDAKKIQNQVLTLADNMAAATGASRDAARDKLATELRKTIKRSVEVYGIITLRTDGNRALFAQRIEKPRTESKKWDTYPMTMKFGKLTYTP